MYCLAAGRLVRPDGDRPVEDGPPAELEVNPFDRLALADNHVETRRCRPVVVFDIDGIGLARADCQLVRSVAGRASAVQTLIHHLAAAVGLDLDARRGRAIGKRDAAADRLGSDHPGGDRSGLTVFNHDATMSVTLARWPEHGARPSKAAASRRWQCHRARSSATSLRLKTLTILRRPSLRTSQL